jgi:hypothetical protein
MKATEIIRGMLDIIDDIETKSRQPDTDGSYADRDIKRFRQIIDLADQQESSTYSNEPKEQYAGIDAVTQDAGADQWQGTKEPEDIRGTTVRIHGDN